MMKTIQNQWLFLYQSFLHANQTIMNPRDELVLIVDKDNNETGSAPRHEMRAGGLPHRACYILVFNSRGELFVQKRTMCKDIYPGYYDVAAGGVVLAGESCHLSASLIAVLPLMPITWIKKRFTPHAASRGAILCR